MLGCRYRAQIGVVDQDPRLFAESVSANICYNCPAGASQVPIDAYKACFRALGPGTWGLGVKIACRVQAAVVLAAVSDSWPGCNVVIRAGCLQDSCTELQDLGLALADAGRMEQGSHALRGCCALSHAGQHQSNHAVSAPSEGTQ